LAQLSFFPFRMMSIDHTIGSGRSMTVDPRGERR
jgi:hypothetical protein